MLLNEFRTHFLSFVPVPRDSIKYKSSADFLEMNYSAEINQVIVEDLNNWSGSWHSLRWLLVLDRGLGRD